ncbi:hypothetical protein C8R43DRAFT_955668 [Mycena crocata]|nr:hypothetical protein C8R43DRAFT_955668 [Mycena crocata]
MTARSIVFNLRKKRETGIWPGGGTLGYPGASKYGDEAAPDDVKELPAGIRYERDRRVKRRSTPRPGEERVTAYGKVECTVRDPGCAACGVQENDGTEAGWRFNQREAEAQQVRDRDLSTVDLRIICVLQRVWLCLTSEIGEPKESRICGGGRNRQTRERHEEDVDAVWALRPIDEAHCTGEGLSTRRMGHGSARASAAHLQTLGKQTEVENAHTRRWSRQFQQHMQVRASRRNTKSCKEVYEAGSAALSAGGLERKASRSPRPKTLGVQVRDQWEAMEESKQDQVFLNNQGRDDKFF